MQLLKMLIITSVAVRSMEQYDGCVVTKECKYEL